jgi:uncharacterized protein YjdB
VSCGSGEKSVSVTGVSVYKTAITLEVGKTETLIVIVAPNDATNKAVTWSSSDTSVATVSKNAFANTCTVTAHAGGTATITATTQDGDHQASCLVTTVVPVTGVTLDRDHLWLPPGGTETLTATIHPPNATNQAVTWSSNNPNLATVSNGIVTAFSNRLLLGRIEITVTTQDGNHQAACALDTFHQLTHISLNKNSTWLTVGGTESLATETLTAIIEPYYATILASAWSSSNASVASVNNDGTVTAHTTGTATITYNVTTPDGNKAASCIVSVVVPPTGVTLDRDNILMTVGSTETLTATIQPSDTNQAITWASSNTSVASVNNGTVAAHRTGTATITVTTQDGNHQASCIVTVEPSTYTVDFHNLRNNDIILIKTNVSDEVVGAADTGRVQGYPAGIANNGAAESFFSLEAALEPVLNEIQKFNANPPPLMEGATYKVQKTSFVPPVVGDTRMFWVFGDNGSAPKVQKKATLRATGQHGNIWVLDESYNPTYTDTHDMVNDAQASYASALFDTIYPLETNLLGFEYGGGPDGDGGIDGDPKIQILLGETNYGGGYFDGVDWYPQSQIPRSNEAEMFYVSPRDAPYYFRVFVHEFQHLINWNQKSVKLGLGTYTPGWYNEMLSMMADDLLVNSCLWDCYWPVEPFYSIRDSVLYFTLRYNLEGITEWNISKDGSYEKAQVFGGYLMRNFGGAKLLQNILNNNKTGVESITEALNEFSPGLTFESALCRFGEAFLYSKTSGIPAGATTFDNTVTNIINGFKYTVLGFDIYASELENDYRFYYPRFFNSLSLTPLDMRPHSFSMHATSAWKNRSGNFSITLERPTNPNIVLQLMVK